MPPIFHFKAVFFDSYTNRAVGVQQKQQKIAGKGEERTAEGDEDIGKASE